LIPERELEKWLPLLRAAAGAQMTHSWQSEVVTTNTNAGIFFFFLLFPFFFFFSLFFPQRKMLENEKGGSRKRMKKKNFSDWNEFTFNLLTKQF
jgi:hypothetical protein